MAAEEEVMFEVEAVEAVYGDDCLVLSTYPPHLHVHLKPRTADDSSQQFVEAVLGIRADLQYPKQLPNIEIVESKGLDEQRQKQLVTSVSGKASELSSCLMLVALCEEGVESISGMNHPDGDCPLCLYPLVGEPFMKLMSCFHCFHCECIIRWWNWLQTLKEIEPTSSSGPTHRPSDGVLGTMEEGNCPVCRKVFHAKDIEHVLDLVESHSQLTSVVAEVHAEENLLQSDSENIRRQKFEAILKLQEENSGLIESKKNEVLLPGMFLQRPITSASTLSDNETSEQQNNRDSTANSETHPSGSSHRARSISKQRHSGTGKQRARNSRKHAQQWIKRDNDSVN